MHAWSHTPVKHKMERGWVQPLGPMPGSSGTPLIPEMLGRPFRKALGRVSGTEEAAQGGRRFPPPPGI